MIFHFCGAQLLPETFIPVYASYVTEETAHRDDASHALPPDGAARDRPLLEARACRAATTLAQQVGRASAK